MGFALLIVIVPVTLLLAILAQAMLAEVCLATVLLACSVAPLLMSSVLGLLLFERDLEGPAPDHELHVEGEHPPGAKPPETTLPVAWIRDG